MTYVNLRDLSPCNDYKMEKYVTSTQPAGMTSKQIILYTLV